MTFILEAWTYRVVGEPSKIISLAVQSASYIPKINLKTHKHTHTHTHTHTHLIDENLAASSSLYILGMVIIRWISTLTKHCMGQPWSTQPGFEQRSKLRFCGVGAPEKIGAQGCSSFQEKIYGKLIGYLYVICIYIYIHIWMRLNEDLTGCIHNQLDMIFACDGNWGIYKSWPVFHREGGHTHWPCGFRY